MQINSEFESFYHALIYFLYTKMTSGPQSMGDLTKAIYAYMTQEEVTVHQPFVDALLALTDDRSLELFETRDRLFDNALPPLPPIDFSQLEKHYLDWVLDHDLIDAFLSHDTQVKLKATLNITSNVFKNKLVPVHSQEQHLTKVDYTHLVTALLSISQAKLLTYVYEDDQGCIFTGSSQPQVVQYDMQSNKHYVLHQPLGSERVVKGLLSRFSLLAPLNSDLPTLVGVDQAWDQALHTFVLTLDLSSPALRQCLVELSVYERVIEKEGQHLRISLTLHEHDIPLLMAKVRSLQPQLRIISPEKYKKAMVKDLKRLSQLLKD